MIVLGRIQKFVGDEDGAIAVPLALLFPVLIGMLSLAVEYGSWQTKRAELQNLADAAVYSGAIQLIQGASATTVQNTIAQITDMSFETGANPSVSYSVPPTLGVYAGQAEYIEVSITKVVPRLLSKLFASDDVIIKVRAVANFGGGQTTACMLALSDNASSAIEVGGSADAKFFGCSLASNSTSDRAFVMNGGSVQVEAGCIDVAGDVVYTSNLILTSCPDPRILQPKTMDPYAQVNVPNVSLISDCQAGGNFKDVTLTPGANSISGTPYACFASSVAFQGDVTLEPGLYIIKDGGLNINSNAQITGTGVTIMFANTADLSVNGTAVLNLTAPTSGEFAGILFMGERTGQVMTHNFNGNAGSQLDGVFYFPKDEFSYTGNSTAASNCVQFLSATILITGNANLNVGCAPSSGKTIYANVRISLKE